jgi:hypothetical protein
MENHNMILFAKKLHIGINLVPLIGFPSYMTWWKVHASLLLYRVKETNHLLDNRGWVG